MALNFEQKKSKVAELQRIIAQSVSIIAADYRGLTVSEITELRSHARKRGVMVRVCRNTFTRRAIRDTRFVCLSNELIGPIVLLLSKDEPNASAKLLCNFMKKNKNLSVKALVVDGTLLGPEQLNAVASLPSREEALRLLISVVKAPITQFVCTLKEPAVQIVRLVALVSNQKCVN